MTRFAEICRRKAAARAIASCCATGAFLTKMGSLHAQTTARDPVGAEALFNEAKREWQAGQWQSACEKFEKSIELDPSASTRSKIAQCREREGKLASAWYEYQLALKLLQELSLGEKRRKELEASIKEKVKELEPRIPKLRITIEPDPRQLKELQLVRDGAAIAVSVVGEALPVDPGEHEVVARAAGYQEQRVHVAVAEGKTVDAPITLVSELSGPVIAGPPGGTTPGAALPVPSQPTRNDQQPASYGNAQESAPRDAGNSSGASWDQKHTAFLLGGAGVVTLGVAGYFGIRTLEFVGQMNDHKKRDGNYDSGVSGPRDQAVRSQNTALVLAGAGAALTGLGIVLYVTAPPKRGAVSGAVGSLVEFSFSPAGVAAGGTW